MSTNVFLLQQSRMSLQVHPPPFGRSPKVGSQQIRRQAWPGVGREKTMRTAVTGQRRQSDECRNE